MKNILAKFSFKALSRGCAALGFALRVRAWLRLVEPCAQACCALPSILKTFLAHILYLGVVKLSMSRHSADMCDRLVRHANLHFTRAWSFIVVSFHLVLVLLVLKVLRFKSYLNNSIIYSFIH